jgi:deazaflavin-dependent oxidoreductase (nitroreductase family)
MPESDWNAQIIEEFRANEGRVGGHFAGAPIVLVHHVGRRSGVARVTPMMYLPDESDENTIYVFASNAGRAGNPAWYHNLVAARETVVERGTETYAVTVQELAGAERDAVYAEQQRRYRGFASYAERTAGIRTIPVLRLTRV